MLIVHFNKLYYSKNDLCINFVLILTYIIIYYSELNIRYYRYLLSFPTRRSSDLGRSDRAIGNRPFAPGPALGRLAPGESGPGDRKSTRLNSSHVATSYAVFCLKKKKKFWAEFYNAPCILCRFDLIMQKVNSNLAP